MHEIALRTRNTVRIADTAGTFHQVTKVTEIQYQALVGIASYGTGGLKPRINGEESGAQPPHLVLRCSPRSGGRGFAAAAAQSP